MLTRRGESGTRYFKIDQRLQTRQALRMDHSQLTPARVLRLRYQIAQQLSAPGSLSGYAADRLARGLAGPSGGSAGSDGQERLRAQLGDLLLLCKDLTAQEEQVCALKYGAAGTVESYRRMRRTCDIRQGDGEDVVKAHSDGWSEVSGKHARYPILSLIASHSGLSERKARRLLEIAQSKIAHRIKQLRVAHQ